jgi:hypothetical protein
MKTILVTRQQLENSGRTLPKRVYRCKACGTIYNHHDEGYLHVTRGCQKLVTR